MRRILSTLAVAVMLSAGLAVAAELQVPLDRAGRVQRIDATLARRLNLFTDRAQFVEARLFQMADSSFVLEISSLTAAGMSRDRVSLTVAGADSLRAIVSAGLETEHIRPELDSAGRPLFVTTTTVMAFGFYGWAVPYLFAQDASSQTVTGIYLMTASAGTFIPMIYTRNRPVTMGMSLAGWYGMSRGAAHGALLANALWEDPPDNSPVASALVVSVAEGITRFHLAERAHSSEGLVSARNTFGDVGLLYGVGVASIADAGRQGGSAAALVGALTGEVVGAFYTPARQYTYGDASVMRTAGIVGGYAGLAIIGTAEGDQLTSKDGTAGAMLGSLAGLVAGHALVRKTDFSFGQGVMVDLSSIGGWLFSLGMSYAISDQNQFDSSTYWAITGAGAVAGYAVGYALSANSARAAATNRTGWRFEVLPTPPEKRGQLPGVTFAVHTALR